MITLKNFIKEILSIFVFLRFKTVKDLYEYLYKNHINSGIYATVFVYYCEKHCSSIGIGATFANWPHFAHGIFSIFISENAKFGKNCIIMQQVTIGTVITKGSKKIGAPTIGDNCYICAGAKIIGNIHIGNNVRIGANAVVYKDVPDNSVVVGNNVIIEKKEPIDNNWYLLCDEDHMLKYDFERRAFDKVDMNEFVGH